MAHISTSGVTKRYGDVTVLSDIGIEIKDGEFLTLLGPSGSGKTTFLMILAGFVEASAGKLYKNKSDITQLPAEKRNFGMVFQGYALFPHLTARQNIEYPLRIRGLDRDQCRSAVERIIATVGLEGHGDKKPSQLSGGQQQRVALARALVFGPDLLLLDEPLSALDRNMREQLQAELKRLHRETGTTFVFVTHDQSEALALSDKIAIFNHGKLVQIDTPEIIYREPATRFVAEFIGNINIVPLKDSVQTGRVVNGSFGGQVLSAPITGKMNGYSSCCLAVRPEHMRVTQDRPENSTNALKARVHDLTYQGATTNLVLSAAENLALTISVSSGESQFRPETGEEIWLSWPVGKGKILTV